MIENGHINLYDQTDVIGNLQTQIAGRNTVIIWRGIGMGELVISIWWDYDHSKHPQPEREEFRTGAPLAKPQHYPKFAGALVSAWLERESGKYLQGRGRDFLADKYARRGELAFLEALPDPLPLGYQAEGQIHL